MAHEIDFSLGAPAIAYRGEKPWHGFGQEITEDLPLEKWRELAGLNWSVTRHPIYTNTYYKQDQEIANQVAGKTRIPNRVALIRDDNKSVLSVVSDRYKVVQPAEVLEFFRDLIDYNGFKMNTAGALREGKRIWALADVGKDFSVGEDTVSGHLLLATAYDGTFSTTVQFTSVRVVCNNTLTWSLQLANGQTKGVVKIPHNQDFNMFDVKAELGLDNGFAQFRDNVVQLAAHKVTKREAINYFLTLLGVTEEQAADGKQLSNVRKLISFYESGPGSQLPSAKDTAWGLVNAVSFFTDHARRAKNEGNRFDSASFGTGNLLKQQAVKQALALAA